MPKKASLKALCLTSVATNMKMWHQVYKESEDDLYECLPYNLAHDILILLEKKNLLRNFHFKLLLHPYMNSLDISETCDHARINTYSYQYVMDLISKRCPNLTDLNLAFSRIDVKTLVQLPALLPNIEALHLCNTETTDEVLSGLGKSCPKLKILDVSNSKVTNSGLAALCGSFRHIKKATGCLRLHRFSVYGTAVTDVGIFCAVMKLPNLKVLYYDPNSALLPVHFIKQNSYKRMTKLKLESLTLNFSLYDQYDTLQIFDSIFEVCPKIRELIIVFQNPLEQVDMLTRFRNLHEMSIIGIGDSVLNAASLLQSIGKQLKILRINAVLQIDINLVAKYCPNLTGLYIRNPGEGSLSILTNKSSSSLQPYTKLEIFEFYFQYTGHYFGFPCSQLIDLFSRSQKLRSINLTNCDALTDQVIKIVLKHNLFHCLESLILNRCKNITSESIICLLALDNPLNFLCICNCTAFTTLDSKLVSDKIVNEKLKIDFVFIPFQLDDYME